MLCPLCKLEMRITNTRNVVEHDDTPDEVTKLFVIQDLSCVNKSCENYALLLSATYRLMHRGKCVF